MAWWSRNRSESTAVLPYRTESLDTVLDTYDVVELTDGVLYVTDITEAAPNPPVKAVEPAPPMAKIGTAKSTYVSAAKEDYNPAMQGLQGLQKYDQMRRNDGSVKGALVARKTPILAARWFVEPFSDDPMDVEIAQFIEWNLFQGMTTSFPQMLAEALGMLDFGWYSFEKVFAEVVWNDQNLIGWQKLAPRHPMDMVEWELDENGGPSVLWLYGAKGSSEGVGIPISKLAVFTHDREGGNLEGVSALRPAYKHWFYKENLYKIDAIQKERHGIGIPIIKLPAGFNAQDKKAAHEIGRNLRTNEKAHVVLPPNWEIIFAKLEGQPVDALDSARHHTSMILQSLLVEWMSRNELGSGDTADQKELFLKSTRYVAEILRDVFNKYCIPQLVNYNWDVKGYPELRVRRIGDVQDWRVITFAVRNLIGAGVIKPDDVLEEWFREEMDMPKADPTTVRDIQPKQQAGLPRQSQAANQKKVPSGNAGKDGSGTSGVAK